MRRYLFALGAAAGFASGALTASIVYDSYLRTAKVKVENCQAAGETLFQRYTQVLVEMEVMKRGVGL